MKTSTTVGYVNKGKQGWLTDLSWDGFSFSKTLGISVIFREKPFIEGSSYPNLGMKLVEVERTVCTFENHDLTDEASRSRKGLFFYSCKNCGLVSRLKKTENSALLSAGLYFQRRTCTSTRFKVLRELNENQT